MKKWAFICLFGLAAIQATHCYGDATIKLSNLDSKLPLDFGNAKVVAKGEDFYVQVLAAPIGPALEMKLPSYYGYLEPVPPLATVGIFEPGEK